MACTRQMITLKKKLWSFKDWNNCHQCFKWISTSLERKKKRKFLKSQLKVWKRRQTWTLLLGNLKVLVFLSMFVKKLKKKKEFYHLHAILVHHGSFNNGHYYCYTRPGLRDKWYNFNNQKAYKVCSKVTFSTGTCVFFSKFELHKWSQQHSKRLALARSQIKSKYKRCYVPCPTL
jgi:hypothetical protein